MRNGNKRGTFGKWVRMGLAFSLMAVCVAWLAEGDRENPSAAPTAATGWGSESLVSLREGLGKVSPIAMANACGMGASSCFKCHNGKRAGAPNMDAAKAAWHAQHKSVNNSCVGCHKGNPRLMKEDMAHAGMLKGPRGGTEACASCHKSDLAKVEAKYKS